MIIRVGANLVFALFILAGLSYILECPYPACYTLIMDYEILDHTADVGVRVYGKSLTELLQNAAVAMMDLISDRAGVEPREKIEISAEGETEEELLIHWLEEILYIHKVRKMVFRDFEVECRRGTLQRALTSVRGKAYGENIDLQKHELAMDIKAVTFHNLKLEPTDNGLKAEIIFDI